MADEKPAKRFHVLGVNDDEDFCMCCGKLHLKRVVWIEDTETGEIRHYGVNCAQNPAKAFGVKAEIQKAVRNYKSFEEGLWRYAHRRYKQAGGKYVKGDDAYSIKVADQELWEKLVSEAREELSKTRPSFVATPTVAQATLF
jgi:hypothetical protein